MKKRINWYGVLAVVVGLCLAGNAFGTNGYFTHGNGTKNKSMAGAGIALPEDAIDVTNNPAVAPFVGDQLVVGAALFSPIRKYSTTASQANGMCSPSGCAITIGPNSITSDSEYFVIPHIAKSWQRDNGTAWALSFYGRGGMNTDWKGGTATFDPDGPGPDFGPTTFPGTYGAGNAGVDYNQAFLDITWAKRINEKVSLGISGVLVAQWFKADGVATFAPLTETYARPFVETGMPGNPTALSNNGHDWSFGAGVRLKTPLEPFVRATYRWNKAYGDNWLWRIEPRVFAQNQRGAGISVQSVLDHVFSDDWLLRFYSIVVAEEEVEGIAWTTKLVAYNNLSDKTAMSYAAYSTGETDYEVPVRDYGFELRYRRQISRDWLFVEFLTYMNWPRDFLIEERERNIGVGIEFEMQFGDWPGRPSQNRGGK